MLRNYLSRKALNEYHVISSSDYIFSFIQIKIDCREVKWNFSILIKCMPNLLNAASSSIRKYDQCGTDI